MLIRPTFAQRLCAGGVSLARPSLKCAGSPHSASVSGLILCLTTGTNTNGNVKCRDIDIDIDIDIDTDTDIDRHFFRYT